MGLIDMPRKMTQVHVLELFSSKHGVKYDYSEVVYVNSNTKVRIVCRTHGIFLVTPSHHINGIGCRRCHFDSIRISKSDFMDRACLHFGARYNYDLFDVLPPVGQKIKIKCTAHDLVFEQDPKAHKNGHVGCPRCKSITLASKQVPASGKFDEAILLSRFIERARSVHGEKYGYTESKYVTLATKIKITCEVHGVFSQIPSNHLAGRGCPTCALEAKKDGTFKKKCEELGVDYWRALKRREAGMPEGKIFDNDYVRSLKETNCLIVHSKSYPNVKKAARALKAPASAKTIARWLDWGMAPEDAFSRVPNPGYGEGIVYLVTHKALEKKYVGITVQSLERRWRFHLEQSRAQSIKNDLSLHAAIREYGADAFTIDQIDTGSSKGSLESKERKWISKLCTLVPNGYNISTGGTSGGSSPRPHTVDGINFSSVKAAASYISETREISTSAAEKRIYVGRINVKKPAPHGESLVKTPAYKSWSRIVHGVLNPKSKEYIQGVGIYDDWRKFHNFLKDVGQPPETGMAFARIDKAVGFVPENCRWMTKSEASKINANYMMQIGMLGLASRQKIDRI